MKQLSYTLIATIFLALAACATMPQTFDERLAVAYATNTEVRNTTAAALRSGRINTDQGRTILRLTDQARSLLDAASGGDERGLDLAIEILENIEEFLR